MLSSTKRNVRVKTAESYILGRLPAQHCLLLPESTAESNDNFEFLPKTKLVRACTRA